jgi:uncharacterized protein
VKKTLSKSIIGNKVKQKLNIGLIGGILGILLLGCVTPSRSIPSLTAQKPPATIERDVPKSSPQAQRLPLSAQIRIGRNPKKILLEVARTQEEQAIGLMYRSELTADRGMLFEFNPPRNVNFWMKNTLIPLDMIFLYKGVVKYIAVDVPPCAGDPCPTYGPPNKIEIDRVIELPGQRSKELGLKVGDPIKIQYFKPKGVKIR